MGLGLYFYPETGGGYELNYTLWHLKYLTKVRTHLGLYFTVKLVLKLITKPEQTL